MRKVYLIASFTSDFQVFNVNFWCFYDSFVYLAVLIEK